VKTDRRLPLFFSTNTLPDTRLLLPWIPFLWFIEASNCIFLITIERNTNMSAHFISGSLLTNTIYLLRINNILLKTWTVVLQLGWMSVVISKYLRNQRNKKPKYERWRYILDLINTKKKCTHTFLTSYCAVWHTIFDFMLIHCTPIFVTSYANSSLRDCAIMFLRNFCNYLPVRTVS
jgi:hypothetical protein